VWGVFFVAFCRVLSRKALAGNDHAAIAIYCVSEECVSESKDARAVREVEAQTSFIRCISRVPHRADIAHKALIVTAGFPKYEALRGFRCVRNALCVREMCRLVEGRTGRASLQALCSLADIDKAGIIV
jgi:hypothetical protein